MKIAIEGCAHGELETIYNTIEYLEKENNITVDLLLCCGDFQATRNLDDLKCMAVPPKFRSICTFYKYFSGEKLAPKLTIFIGGNHEASNYLQELPYGGWVAPNIYYLGYAGVVNVGGIRIAGLSGIFKGYDFARGRFEKPPYDRETIRSCYHFRNIDVYRLKQLSSHVNIMLSHDWPAGIEKFGNVRLLLKIKPYFKDEIKTNTLGNDPAFELLRHMKPDYWFAAHLHVKFAAVMEHKDGSECKKTKFLSLDKCLPKRKFLQIIDIPHESENDLSLKYDLEWLTVLHLTNHLLSVKKVNNYLPGPSKTCERWMFTPSKEEMDLVMKRFQHDLTIPNNFVPTAPAYNPNEPRKFGGVKCVQNPQTVEFCEKLGIDDPITLLLNESGLNVSGTGSSMSSLEFSSFIEPTKPEIEEMSSPSFVRTPLKLPTPSVELYDKEENILTSTPIEKTQAKVLESSLTKNSFDLEPKPEESESNVEQEESKEAPSEPGPKKFKRRNMALYASNDDD